MRCTDAKTLVQDMVALLSYANNRTPPAASIGAFTNLIMERLSRYHQHDRSNNLFVMLLVIFEYYEVLDSPSNFPYPVWYRDYKGLMIRALGLPNAGDHRWNENLQRINQIPHYLRELIAISTRDVENLYPNQSFEKKRHRAHHRVWQALRYTWPSTHPKNFQQCLDKLQSSSHVLYHRPLFTDAGGIVLRPEQGIPPLPKPKPNKVFGASEVQRSEQHFTAKFKLALETTKDGVTKLSAAEIARAWKRKIFQRPKMYNDSPENAPNLDSLPNNPGDSIQIAESDLDLNPQFQFSNQLTLPSPLLLETNTNIPTSPASFLMEEDDPLFSFLHGTEVVRSQKRAAPDEWSADEPLHKKLRSDDWEW